MNYILSLLATRKSIKFLCSESSIVVQLVQVVECRLGFSYEIGSYRESTAFINEVPNYSKFMQKKKKHFLLCS